PTKRRVSSPPHLRARGEIADPQGGARLGGGVVIPEGVEGDEAGSSDLGPVHGGVSVGQGGGEAGRAGGGKVDAGGRHGHMVYTAPTEAAATERFLEFAEARGSRYPAIVKLWETPGPSSRRSWPSTPRSGGSSAPPTPSRAST